MNENVGKFADNFPGYLGFVPLKNDVIGMTIGAANEYVRNNIEKKPIESDNLGPLKYDDYSQYHKDYFNKNFSRDYPLEEDKIYSYNSKDAETWICGSKYKIYPQHIPGYKAFIPGIYSSNIHGNGYSKVTAKAIKGDYNKEFTITPSERFISTAKQYFKKPQIKTEEEELMMKNLIKEKKKELTGEKEKVNFKAEVKKMYKSKIANVPTPGYTGHQSIYIQPISYLNKDKILQDLEEREILEKLKNQNVDNQTVSGYYRKTIENEKEDPGELPYVVGYGGYRIGVKPKNYYASNFQVSSLKARKEVMSD